MEGSWKTTGKVLFNLSENLNKKYCKVLKYYWKKFLFQIICIAVFIDQTIRLVFQPVCSILNVCKFIHLNILQQTFVLADDGLRLEPTTESSEGSWPAPTLTPTRSG